MLVTHANRLATLRACSQCAVLEPDARSIKRSVNQILRVAALPLQSDQADALCQAVRIDT